MNDLQYLTRNIDDISSGSIILIGSSCEPILVVNSRGLGKWGINLNYGPTWFNPHDIIPNIVSDCPISYKWIFRAKLKLHDFLEGKWFSNLDYIEALVKLKEYEKEKACNS
jgi:hypothetical protein